MDFGDLPSGLEQKNVQSEHRSQKHRLLVYSVLMDVQTSEPHHQGAIDQNSKTQKKMVKVSESRQSMKSLTLLTCSTHGAAHGLHMLAASLRRLPSCGSFTASRLSRTAAVLDFL